MVSSVARSIGWYGKLPSRGDFVGRGLPAAWRHEWDRWLQRGLALAAAKIGSGELRELVLAFPSWRYAVRADDGERWCGIVVASQDRVGRAFPLTIVEQFAPGSSPDPRGVAGRLSGLLGAADQGPDVLEATIATLVPAAGSMNAAEAWPDIGASHWWRLSAPAGVAPIVSTWPPDPELLVALLQAQPGSHHSASAE